MIDNAEARAKQVRRIYRTCGMAIVDAMAITDTSFAEIAARLEVGEDHVRQWVLSFIEGTLDEREFNGIRILSNILLTMGMGLHFQLYKPGEPSKTGEQS